MARGEDTRVNVSASTRAAATIPPEDNRPVVADRPGRFHRGSAVVMVVGLVVTLALSFGAAALNVRNENRLLHQRAREIGLVVEAATATNQLPVQVGVIVAAATRGDVATFKGLAALVTGPGSSNQYVSASLWHLGATPTPIATVGARPQIAGDSQAQLRAFFAKANGKELTISDLLDTTPRRLGYVITSPGDNPEYAVYTESVLPKDRKAKIGNDSAFSDLDYALYLGKQPDNAKLLASSTGHGISGHEASASAKYGNTSILIAVTTHAQLGGTLLLRLPWLLAALGILLTAASTLLAERLIRRREAAETLATELDAAASENERLYNEQRSVARTLQHTLLPTALPHVGFELAARYVAGDVDVEIGGDWYDVVPLDHGRALFVIGDVSGRGIPAATVMASLRYSLRAYAAQGDEPAVILTKLARLLSIKDDGHFATVLCGRIDLRARRMDMANAGHLAPLLITGPGESRYLRTQPGVPIGAVEDPSYRSVSIDLPPAGTLLLYTDGLIERRGESLDTGFARLARAAENEADAPVEALLARVVTDLIPGGANDDTALLGLRWKT